MNVRALISWFLFLAVETATQVTFKIGGATLDARHGLWPLIAHSAVSPWVPGGFLLYFGCFILWMSILKDADLGRAFPMTALIYLCTLGAAIFLFHETLSPLRIVGILAIIIGVVVLVSDENSPEVVESPVHG
jgi:drug/metabolite transporter (DMT)-like permease